MQEIFLEIRYLEILERGLSKSLKKVNFTFSFEPSLLNGQNYQKQKGPGTSDQSSSSYETNSEKFFYS